jgi:hypothetical protein
MIRFQTDDCFTPEEEAAQDAREAEREVDEWLASWSDDFHSDEWAAALAPTSADEAHDRMMFRQQVSA